MKRLPVCFGDYHIHDRNCNGHGQVPACLVRDRCSAFQQLLKEREQDREEHLRITSRYTYIQPEMVRELDLKVAALGIKDGLVSWSHKQNKHVRKVQIEMPSAEGLGTIFLECLSKSSQRKVRPRYGASDVGELYCTTHWRTGNSSDVRAIYVRTDDMGGRDLICTMKLKRRSSLIDITIPLPRFEMQLNKRERMQFTFSGNELTTTLNNLDRYRCSVLANRLALAINGGVMDKPRSAA